MNEYGIYAILFHDFGEKLLIYILITLGLLLLLMINSLVMKIMESYSHCTLQQKGMNYGLIFN